MNMNMGTGQGSRCFNMLIMYKLTARYKSFPRLNIGELAVIVASIVATLITLVFGCEHKIAPWARKVCPMTLRLAQKPQRLLPELNLSGETEIRPRLAYRRG